jgi:hypothetical protein
MKAIMKFSFTLKCAAYLNYENDYRLLNSEPVRCFKEPNHISRYNLHLP